MTPPLSILMPVRNEAATLPAALRSLANQSFSDWELVVVDDGSADATPQILAAAAATDRRIRILHQPARGLVAALNHGLAECRAELVARMDGDDICHPARLAKQFDFLAAHPEIDVLACRVQHFPASLVTDGMRQYETWQNNLLDHAAIMRDLLVESPLAHPSVVYRRAPVIARGGYRDRGWPEDYDLWLRLAAAGSRFARLPELLFYWRDRPRRFTRTSPCCTPEAFRRCKLDHLRRTFLADCDSVTIWGAGVEGKAWRRTLLEAGIVVNRWAEVDPRKIGQTIHGAPVVSWQQLQPGTGPILVAIGARAARPQVRAHAVHAGLVEGRDFLCIS